MTNALTPSLPYAAEIERDPRLASIHTRRAYRSAIGKFEEFRAGRLLTQTLVEEYLVTLQRSGLKPESINRHLAAVRWWARRVAKLAGEYADPEQARTIADRAAHVTNIPDLKGYTVPPGRHLGDDEIQSLLHACAEDPEIIGRRDAAILAVAYATGARIHEIKALTVADITYTQDGTAADLLFHGKGQKERVVPVTNRDVLDALDRWLNIRGVNPGIVFNPCRKGGKVIASHGISLEGLRKILVKRTKEAGIIKPLTWHDFRRTLAGRLFDAGVDISVNQKVLGHADPKTTARYDRRAETRKRESLDIVTKLSLEIRE